MRYFSFGQFQPTSFTQKTLTQKTLTQKTLVVAVATLLSQQAFAETSKTAIAEPLPETTLQTIYVTSAPSNYQQKSKINTQDYTPASQATHLSNFLETAPGVTVGGTSTLDQRIYIRGVDDNDLKVTIDGARQENYFFHHAGSVAIDPDLLKSAEVAVGNNSVTLGNRALGGAVAFTTVDASDLLQPDQKIGAKFKLGYGSNDKQVHGTATVFAKPTENSDLLLSYGQRKSDGGEDGNGKHIQGDDITIDNILAKVNISPTDNQKFTLSYQSYNDEGNYPFRPNVGYQANYPKSILPAQFKRETYSLNYNYKPSDTLEMNLNAYHNDAKILLQGARTPTATDPSTRSRIHTQGKTDGITAKVHQKINTNAVKHYLTYGVEGYEKNSENLGNTNNGHKQKATNISGYLEDTMTFGKDGRFSLTPGIRYDHYKSPKFVGEKTYNEVTGALAGKISLTPDTHVFASYTQLFSGPNLPEMIYNGRDVYVNNDLKGDKGANAEVGFSHRFRNLLADNDRLNLTAKYFNTKFDDKVNSVSGVNCKTGLVQTGGACVAYSNAGKTDIKGYEIGATYNLANLAMKTSYAHSKGELENGANLGKDSGDRVNVGFDYQVNDQLNFGTNLNWVRSFDRKSVSRGKLISTHLPAYHTVDVFGTYSPKSLSGVKLELGVYNLENATYATHTSNPADTKMGRNAKVALSYQF